MELRDLSYLFLVMFTGLAFFDGIILHLWKYKLYKYNDTIYEHKLHTFRAILFPFVLVGFFLYELSGILYILTLFIVSVDIVIQIFDMMEEKDARSRFGGLSSFEYILHVTLTSLHSSMLLLYILSKPKNSISFEIMEINVTNGIHHFVAINLLPGAIFIAILHIVLCHPYFREPNVSTMFKTKERNQNLNLNENPN
ncbi:hypothetical protein EHQ46_08980 [Leptospira yanagawae]|uniref:Uncharacterized protein n=1 Tax=Leptospira yanagawae TaxID=293069 RepID=A0ABY2M312_9LEPT|nr:hypothetical protein [Leptospira yanagawae]TGL21072.1 hypothetical protein EHQ46_08980 [Leptospira yanagawae]